MRVLLNLSSEPQADGALVLGSALEPGAALVGLMKLTECAGPVTLSAVQIQTTTVSVSRLECSCRLKTEQLSVRGLPIIKTKLLIA